MRVSALRFSGALFVVLSVVSGARSQSTPAQRPLSFRSLTARVPQASATGLVTELRIQWITSTRSNGTATSAPARIHSFKLLEAKMTRGRLRRARRPELSADQLVVVVQARDGRELDWRLLGNPRIVRAEVPGPDGRLGGQILERDAVELSFAIPRMPNATSIRVYQPRWTGTEYVLDTIGDVSVVGSR